MLFLEYSAKTQVAVRPLPWVMCCHTLYARAVDSQQSQPRTLTPRKGFYRQVNNTYYTIQKGCSVKLTAAAKSGTNAPIARGL